MRKEIDEWAKENLAGKKIWITALNKMVEFRYRNGIQHDLSRNYHEPLVEIALIKQFPELLLTAIYMGFDKNTDKTQKEDRDRLYYYDHGIIKEIE